MLPAVWTLGGASPMALTLGTEGFSRTMLCLVTRRVSEERTQNPR